MIIDRLINTGLIYYKIIVFVTPTRERASACNTLCLDIRRCKTEPFFFINNTDLYVDQDEGYSKKFAYKTDHSICVRCRQQ